MIAIQTHCFGLTKLADFDPIFKFHPQIAAAQAEYIDTSQLENLPPVTVLESKYPKYSQRGCC